MSAPVPSGASAIAPASLATRAAPPARDAVEHPAAVWWVVVLGGLTVLGLQGWNADFYAWWTAHVNALPGQSVMAWIFIGCVPIHVGEAAFVYVTAPRRGLSRSRLAWTVQTFFLGYPSTHLFRKRPARPGVAAAS